MECQCISWTEMHSDFNLYNLFSSKSKSSDTLLYHIREIPLVAISMH